jgi:2-polyprenyl-3-methyl-5-hydroxy-6-metoxy-1,4-benzoquinol methylase
MKMLRKLVAVVKSLLSLEKRFDDADRKLDNIGRKLDDIDQLMRSELNSRALTIEWITNNTRLEVNHLIESNDRKLDDIDQFMRSELNSRALTIEWNTNSTRLEVNQLLESNDRKLDDIDQFMRSELNSRALTIEWITNNTRLEVNHLLEIKSLEVLRLEVMSDEILNRVSSYSKYDLICTKNIASDSFDNIDPESTFEGLVSRPLFVLACERITKKEKLSFLDIGCGAGAIVFDFIKRGHMAVGLDGSDACKLLDKGYWKHIKHLHTCDVTKYFKFIDKNNTALKFDVISMWEVFEHIPEELCPSVLKNVHSNLADDGLFVGSISRLEYVNATSGIPYHVTLKDPAWWECLFTENGFDFISSEFRSEEYCRGVGNRYQDLHNYNTHPEYGFHFTAKKIIEFSKH